MIAKDLLLPQRRPAIRSALAGLSLLGTLLLAPVPGLPQTQVYIVQGPDLESAKAAVLAVGGEVTHELGIISSVGAQLTPDQREAIEADKAFRVRADGKVQTNPAEPDK